MENKKFEMLNTSKKLTTTHAELQRNVIIKKGGRPKKSNKDKLNCIVSLNVSRYEKDILEAKAASNGLNVVSLVRMSLGRVLKQDFVPMSANVDGFEFDVGLSGDVGSGEWGDNDGKNGGNGGNRNSKKVIKQYAVPVTNLVKLQLENRANEYMISVSELLKISLRVSGWLG